MRFTTIIAATWFCGIAGAGTAHAEALVAGSNQSQTVECGGDDAVVRGNDNRLEFTGGCRSLLVEGNNNAIRAAVVAEAPITVRGNGNRLRYGGAGASNAQVQVAGNDDLVNPVGSLAPAAEPDGAVPAADAVTLREENAHRTVPCAGRDVLIEGNGDEYTLVGGCRSLLVRGEGLVVHADMRPASRIRLQGNGDVVTWTLSAAGAEPVTSVDGEGSRVSRADQAGAEPPATTAPAGETAAPLPVATSAPSRPDVAKPAPHPAAPHPAAPASPAREPPRADALVIRGDHEARDLDCGGRPVRIEASYAIVALRGACRSVTVHGDSDKVQAEVAAGGKVAVQGTGSTLAYVVIGAGPDPATDVKGGNSRAWRIPRLGAISPAGAAEGEHPAAAPAQPLPATTP